MMELIKMASFDATKRDERLVIHVPCGSGSLVSYDQKYMLTDLFPRLLNLDHKSS